MAEKTVSPGGRNGDTGLPVPLANAHTVKSTNGIMTTACTMIRALPVRSRPRMLMNVKKATRAMPNSQRQLSLNCHLVWM